MSVLSIPEFKHIIIAEIRLEDSPLTSSKSPAFRAIDQDDKRDESAVPKLDPKKQSNADDASETQSTGAFPLRNRRRPRLPERDGRNIDLYAIPAVAGF